MERSEPALVPEWLRIAGNVAGSGSSVHRQVSSASHTDVTSLAHNTRNRISKNSSEFDNPRFEYLERSSSSNSRRSSSNGSAKHAYSSFNRNHRDREKEKSSFGDHWDRDSSDPLATIFSGRMEKDTLRRSHSMISRKPGEVLPRRVAVDANNDQSSGNGIFSGSGIGSNIHKAVFDKDFPSLGTEEKPAVSEIIRVPSPVLCTAGQSLPVGSSTLIGGEGWTSALAEVPAIICSNSSGSSSLHHTVSVTSLPASPSSTAALNMAEALTQTPSRVHTTPLASVKTQRLEELAIKQSRQLIPVTPTMPKASVFSSEKSKPKTAAKNVDVNVASKSGLQPTTLHLGTSPVRSGNVKPDVSAVSGKLVVLKPRENGVSLVSKDAVSPTNNIIDKGGNQNPLVPSFGPAHSKSPNNGKPSTERKSAPLDSRSGPTLEKRASLSQVQSRNDFFNLIKKKTSRNDCTSESGPVMSATTMHNCTEVSMVVDGAPVCPHSPENGTRVASNGDARGQVHTLSDCKQDDMTANDAIYPDEEEAAFLRSLGWDENSGEDEGLTEEEINAFVHQYMKLFPSLKLCQVMQPKVSKLPESRTTKSGGASADLSSLDAESGE